MWLDSGTCAGRRAAEEGVGPWLDAEAGATEWGVADPLEEPSG